MSRWRRRPAPPPQEGAGAIGPPGPKVIVASSRRGSSPRRGCRPAAVTVPLVGMWPPAWAGCPAPKASGGTSPTWVGAAACASPVPWTTRSTAPSASPCPMHTSTSSTAGLPAASRRVASRAAPGTAAASVHMAAQLA